MLSLELKKYRSSHALSQEELAKLLNISRSAVAKWEQQKGFPSKTSLDDISKLLNLSKDELLKEEDHSLIIESIIKDTKIKKLILSSIFSIIIIFLLILLIVKNKKQDIIDKVISPNEETVLTVYNNGSGYIIEVSGTFKGKWIKDDCTYIGLYWSADSRFVVESYYVHEARQCYLELTDFERNSGHNLQASLNSALRRYYNIAYFEIALYDFQFLDWSDEANIMLIKYNLEYQEQKIIGYFWFVPYSLEVNGITEINS